MSNKVFLELSGNEEQIAKILDILPGGPDGEVQFFGGLMGFRGVEREDNIIEFEADDFKVSKILLDRSHNYPDVFFKMRYELPNENDPFEGIIQNGEVLDIAEVMLYNF